MIRSAKFLRNEAGPSKNSPEQESELIMITDKIALFIDGANVYATAKALGGTMDYKVLLKEYEGKLVRAYYYTAIIETGEYSTIRPLLDWLQYNGFMLKSKPTKEYVDSSGRRKVKGDMDIELAIDMLDLALTGKVDKIVLFTGDGDFKAAVEAVQRRGVRVEVVSTMAVEPPMISDELRRQADAFIELAKQPYLKKDVREPKNSAAPSLAPAK